MCEKCYLRIRVFIRELKIIANSSNDIDISYKYRVVWKSKRKAQVFMGSFKRIELSIPDQKTTSLALVDVNYTFSFPCH